MIERFDLVVGLNGYPVDGNHPQAHGLLKLIAGSALYAVGQKLIDSERLLPFVYLQGKTFKEFIAALGDPILCFGVHICKGKAWGFVGTFVFL